MATGWTGEANKRLASLLWHAERKKRKNGTGFRILLALFSDKIKKNQKKNYKGILFKGLFKKKKKNFVFLAIVYGSKSNNSNNMKT